MLKNTQLHQQLKMCSGSNSYLHCQFVALKQIPNFVWLIITIIIQWSTFSGVVSTGLIDAVCPVGNATIPKVELFPPYSIYRKRLTWAEAQAYCEKKREGLATFVDMQSAKDIAQAIFTISDEVSEDFLHGRNKSEFGLNRRYWIGLTDLVTGEGNWFWAGKGVPLSYSSMWYPGQPDHFTEDGYSSGRPEHCALFWNPLFHRGDQTHTFADVDCSRKYYFICEYGADKLEAQMNQTINTGRNIAQRRQKQRTLGQKPVNVVASASTEVSYSTEAESHETSED